MKKVILIIFAILILLCSCFTCSASEISDVHFADFNCDGINDISDVTEFQKLIVTGDIDSSYYLVVPRDELDYMYEQLDYISSQNSDIFYAFDNLSFDNSSSEQLEQNAELTNNCLLFIIGLGCSLIVLFILYKIFDILR